LQTYINWARDVIDLTERLKIRTETAVHREYLAVNYGSKWKVAEAIVEHFPKWDVVSPLALIVEPVDPINGSALMGST
jgi:hypothetical protein